MKQKQVKTTPKVAKQTKTIKKASPPKKVHVMPEEGDESEEEQRVQTKVVKKPVTKKATKAKKVVVEEPVEEVEDEPEEEDVEDPEEDAADEEEQNEDMEENDDEDEEEEEDDDDEDEDDDDEGPSEEAIGTEEPTIPSKVKSGPIPPTLPVQTIIHVSNLPKQCKQIDLVEAFGKYGAILHINLVPAPSDTSATSADIAFKTAKAAFAAVEADQIEVLDSVVTVAKKRDSYNLKNQTDLENCVRVFYVRRNTTEQQVREHFGSCGEIETVKYVKKPNGTPINVFVAFKEKSAVAAALKLHNSILNEGNIKVYDTSVKEKLRCYDETLTVLMRNKQALRCVDVAKLERIFAECGQINYIDMLCRGTMLAFLTFETKEAAESAVKLSGETREGIELEIEPYNPLKKWTTIYVSNIPKGCDQYELQHHFSRAGKVEHVTVRKNYAVIRFKDSDGYCRSFLFSESFFRGNMIFVQPNSSRKVNPRKAPMKQTFKRHFDNGNSSFKAKRPRINQ